MSQNAKLDIIVSLLTRTLSIESRKNILLTLLNSLDILFALSTFNVLSVPLSHKFVPGLQHYFGKLPGLILDGHALPIFLARVSRPQGHPRGYRRRRLRYRFHIDRVKQGAIDCLEGPLEGALAGGSHVFVLVLRSQAHVRHSAIYAHLFDK